MNQRGIALLVTLILLGTIIATVLSISVLITGETKITRLVDDSVLAIFAADAGMEKMFYACSGKIGSPSPASFTNNNIGNSAKYEVHMDDDGDVPYTDSCNDKLVISRGQFGATQRSFQATY